MGASEAAGGVAMCKIVVSYEYLRPSWELGGGSLVWLSWVSTAFAVADLCWVACCLVAWALLGLLCFLRVTQCKQGLW